MDKFQLLLPILFFYLFIAIIVVIILQLLKQNKIYGNSKVLDKNYLKSQIKSIGTSYFLLLLGLHYIYMGRLLLQILYWLTFGGFGIWFIVDLVTLSNRISNHNAILYKLIDDIENSELTK